MLADRNSTIINEPLLARHARHMHQFAQAVVRKTFMSGFDPHVATDILTAAHKRRSMDVTLMPRSELTREIAIEEMRREINVTIANRISKVLLLVLACVVFLVITLYGFLWDQSDHLKGVYLQARGMGSSQATRQAEQAPARELTPMQQKVKRLREQAREKLRQLKDLERQAAPDSSLGLNIHAHSFATWRAAPLLPPLLSQSPRSEGKRIGAAADPVRADSNHKGDSARATLESAARRLAQARAAAFKKAFGIDQGAEEKRSNRQAQDNSRGVSESTSKKESQ